MLVQDAKGNYTGYRLNNQVYTLDKPGGTFITQQAAAQAKPETTLSQVQNLNWDQIKQLHDQAKLINPDLKNEDFTAWVYRYAANPELAVKQLNYKPPVKEADVVPSTPATPERTSIEGCTRGSRNSTPARSSAVVSGVWHPLKYFMS